MTRERPIIMSGDSVRSILAGEKSQTRRIIKPQPGILHLRDDASEDGPYLPHWVIEHSHRSKRSAWPVGDPPYWTHCPYGAKGDRLWVREAWGFSARVSTDHHERWMAEQDRTFLVYRATVIEGDNAARWRSPIHMPRWASRLTLEVTGGRVERLQEISEEDAKAEGLKTQVGDGCERGPGFKWKGIGYHGGNVGPMGKGYHVPDHHGRCRCLIGGPSPAQCAYREVWDRLNGKRAPWKSNPFVWVLDFRRVTP